MVRSAHRLDALSYELRDATDPAHPWACTQTYELQPARSLSKHLASAWTALERVSEWNEATLAHVLTMLRETVPSSEMPGDLPTLGPEVQALPAPRATAAHPRAYRGTKYRPPKPRQPQRIDLRPYLLSRRHTEQVLELLGHRRERDLSATLDAAFVMYLLPLVRDCTSSDIGSFAALAKALELQEQPDLRAAVVGLYLNAGDPGRALAWWSHVLAHEPHQRLEVATLASASGITKVEPPSPDVASDLARLPLVQRWSIYRGLVAGAQPAYITSGLHLGAISASKIDEIPAGRADVSMLIESTVERLATAMDEDSGAEFWRTHLWRLCGHQPELIDVLASPDFTSLRSDAAFSIIRIANLPRWSPETAVKEWRQLAIQLPLIVEFAARVAPDYQRKFTQCTSDVYCWAVDNEHDITDALAKCVDLCFRIAKPPFTTDSTVGLTLPSLGLVYVDRDVWQARHVIRDAPDASWLALEHACKRANNMRLLAQGLNRLSQFVTTLFVQTFATNPRVLLETAGSLAMVSFEEAERIAVAYAKSALASDAAAHAPVETLCALIEPVAKMGGPNPIRRALREHMSGTSTLTAQQVSGHRERLVARLPTVRLAALRQAVERWLARHVGASTIATDGMRHGLAMLTNVACHRRQLKRLLTAIATGDAGWTLRHPRTKSWLARHPALNTAAWTEGVELRRTIGGLGEITISVEKDPLEALKLGTYVGSCLGRGGHFEFSAAAVVLDINKTVIYARDANGSVIARQLVAVSEADELVCFSVYGSAKRELIEPFVREFDRVFASAIGLPLFSDDNDSYVIASILSHDWYDDSAWVEDRE